MKQVLQNMRDGKTVVTEVPIPTPGKGQALVRVSASLVSAGTERKLVEFGEKSLVGKARSRPDLVRQVLDKARREGVGATLKATFNRLDQPWRWATPPAGTIVSLGAGMEGFKVGQRVACAGGGYAVHAGYNLVPRNLLTPCPMAWTSSRRRSPPWRRSPCTVTDWLNPRWGKARRSSALVCWGY